MERKLTTLGETMDVMGKTVVKLESDVSVLKSDVSVLKSDVSVLKTDVAILKSDVAILKIDVSDLKVEVREQRTVLHRVAAIVVRLEEKFDAAFGPNGRIEKIETAIVNIFNILDGTVRNGEDLRFRYAVHADTLLEHDKRLKKLEARDA